MILDLTGVNEGLQYVAGVICGSIVNDEDSVIGKGLSKNRLDRSYDQTRSVMGRNHDTYGGIHIKVLNYYGKKIKRFTVNLFTEYFF